MRPDQRLGPGRRGRLLGVAEALGDPAGTAQLPEQRVACPLPAVSVVAGRPRSSRLASYNVILEQAWPSAQPGS